MFLTSVSVADVETPSDIDAVSFPFEFRENESTRQATHNVNYRLTIDDNNNNNNVWIEQKKKDTP